MPLRLSGFYVQTFLTPKYRPRQLALGIFRLMITIRLNGALFNNFDWLFNFEALGLLFDLALGAKPIRRLYIWPFHQASARRMLGKADNLVD